MGQEYAETYYPNSAGEAAEVTWQLDNLPANQFTMPCFPQNFVAEDMKLQIRITHLPCPQVHELRALSVHSVRQRHLSPSPKPEASKYLILGRHRLTTDPRISVSLSREEEEEEEEEEGQGDRDTDDDHESDAESFADWSSNSLQIQPNDPAVDVILRFCYFAVTEDFEGGTASSTMLVYFSGVRGLFFPDGDEYLLPHRFIPILARLLYCMRLVFLEAVLPYPSEAVDSRKEYGTRHLLQPE